MGTVPVGLADIFDLCVIFVCFDDLRLPWGQSPQVLRTRCPLSQCAAKMAAFPGGHFFREERKRGGILGELAIDKNGRREYNRQR